MKLLEEFRGFGSYQRPQTGVVPTGFQQPAPLGFPHCSREEVVKLADSFHGPLMAQMIDLYWESTGKETDNIITVPISISLGCSTAVLPQVLIRILRDV